MTHTTPEVLLINPPFRARTARIAQASLGPPLGLGYLAASLEAAGVTVAILDANALGLSFQETVHRATRVGARVVGLSAATPSVRLAGRIACGIKAARRSTVTVLGGPHATALPRETLAEEGGFDALVSGEGEAALLALASGEASAPGLYRHVNGKVRGHGLGHVANVRALPWPARHLLPNHRYRTPDSSHFTTIIAQRGCPATCTYCGVPALVGREVRRREPEDVAAEMAACHRDLGVRYVGFLDDTFTLDGLWVHALCEAVRAERLPGRVRWSCLTRANAVDPPMLRALRSAGCVRLEIGIESGSASVLHSLKKGVSLASMRRAFREARTAGLSVLGFVMLNAPGETPADLEATVELVESLAPDHVQVSLATPYPGTAMREECVRRGIAIDSNWERYSFLNDVVIREPSRSLDLLRNTVSRLNRTVYLRPDWALRQATRLATGDLELGAFASAAVRGALALSAATLGRFDRSDRTSRPAEAPIGPTRDCV